MEQHPPLHLNVVAIDKGAFGSPSFKVANFYSKYEYGFYWWKQYIEFIKI